MGKWKKRGLKWAMYLALLGGLGGFLYQALDPGIGPLPRWTLNGDPMFLGMSPDGRLLVVNERIPDDYDGRLQIWDTQQNQIVYQAEGKFWLADIFVTEDPLQDFFTRDWRWFLLPGKPKEWTDFQNFYLVDLSTGKEVLVDLASRFREAAKRNPNLFESRDYMGRPLGDLNNMPLMKVSPDQRYLALVPEGGSLFIVETATGKILHEAFEFRKAENRNWHPSFHFLPNRNVLLYHGWNEKKSAHGLWEWDLDNNKKILLQDNVLPRPVIAPEQSFWAMVVSSGDKSFQLCLWDVQKQKAQTLMETTDPSWHFTFSPDRRWLAGWIWEKKPIQIYFWETATGKQVDKLDLKDEKIKWVKGQFAPSGPWFVMKNINAVEVYDLLQKNRVWSTKSRLFQNLYFPKNSKTLFMRGLDKAKLEQFQLPTGQPLPLEWQTEEDLKVWPKLEKIKISGPDRALVVRSGGDWELQTFKVLAQVVELSSQKELARVETNSNVLDLSHDGNTLFTQKKIGQRYQMQLWDVPFREGSLPRPWLWIIGLPLALGGALFGLDYLWHRKTQRKSIGIFGGQE